jgi:DNA-directed RNA polymerase II subunit RPB2
MTTQKTLDKLLDLYFNQPNILYEHLFSGFDQFVNEQIPYSLIHESNYFYENVDKDIIYLHGFKCSNIKVKPSLFDNDNEIKFPSDARKNQLNYFGTVIADIQQYVEKQDTKTGEKTIKYISEIEKETHIAGIPIMVKSKLCTTNIKKDARNECKYDPGGYFIVNGAEKVVMSIEKMVDNKILVFTKKDQSYDNNLIYSAQINSRKNDWSDNLQILTIKTRKDGVLIVTTSSQLVDIPLFILMRALGVESDKDIISYITYDLDDIQMLNLIRPSINLSVDDENIKINSKEDAIEYLITKLKKNKRISLTDEHIASIQKKMQLEKILRQDLLPHLGEDITKKITFLGLMANRLLSVMLGRADVDDRDALQNKRIETPGILLGQLFRQNWKKMLNEIGKIFKKKNQSDENPINVVGQIKSSTIEQGIKKALATGIWGMNKTKKGVAQALQRLSWIQGTSNLRKVTSPSLDESTAKVTSIRHVANNQCQMLDPCETPEGAKIGIMKSLSMIATISTNNNTQLKIINELIKNDYIKKGFIKHPYDINPLDMKKWVKLFINGDWLGVCDISKAYDLYVFLKLKRRENILDKYTTILFDYRNKEIRIYSDGGRLIRPLLIVNNNKLNLTKEIIKDIDEEYEKENKIKSWKNILSKYPHLIEYEDIETLNYLLVAEREYKLDENNNNKNRLVVYNESTQINRYGDYRWVNYTHCEFHDWTMLGLVVSNIPFSNHNYTYRNFIHFSQAKQSIGIYLTSYKDRMDISQVLYYPQTPLVTTQAMKYNGCLDLPYGQNAIVAICSYTGYNQEDSIIFNQSAIDRGIFRADTLKKYHSEIEKNPSTSQDDIFTKPDRTKVTGMKQGSYDKLNDKGFVPEETEIFNEDVIIGKISPTQPTKDNKVYKDSSVIFKSNIPGVIDRVHTGIYNAEGYEIYNVRVRLERVPIVGDKFTCYDNQHEILTSEGWIHFSKLSLNHKVASLVNNKLEFVNPIEIQSYDYNDKLIYVNNDNIDLCITPKHRMYIRYDDYYEIDYAYNVIDNNGYYKKNVDNIDVLDINNEMFIINELVGITDIIINNTKYSILVFLNLFVRYLCNQYKSYEQVLDNYFSNLNINEGLPKYFKSFNKMLYQYIYSQLLNYNDKYIYKTDSKKLIDDLQILIFYSGYAADIYHDTDYYYLIKSNMEPFVKTTHYDVINYNDKIYCCTVPDEGIIYVRRNGKGCWSGNSRSGQKGTVGIVYQQKDMPFTESGIVPDLILNPHGYPSRMSISHFIETLASKFGALTGKFVDGTPFNNYDVKELGEKLTKLGFSSNGTEKMYCGITGRKMDVEIFIGPVYIVRLKHMVQDKVHGRAHGPKQSLTRQPLEGRSKDGGLKIGEMEQNAIVAHGMGQFLKERFMETSDITKVYVCDDCGMFVSKVIDKDYYKCKGCKNNTTRISPVVIPYACKLLFQELTSVNILPRIITEKSTNN